MAEQKKEKATVVNDLETFVGKLTGLLTDKQNTELNLQKSEELHTKNSQKLNEHTEILQKIAVETDKNNNANIQRHQANAAEIARQTNEIVILKAEIQALKNKTELEHKNLAESDGKIIVAVDDIIKSLQAGFISLQKKDEIQEKIMVKINEYLTDPEIIKSRKLNASLVDQINFLRKALLLANDREQKK
jgi:hypothetical protein